MRPNNSTNISLVIIGACSQFFLWLSRKEIGTAPFREIRVLSSPEAVIRYLGWRPEDYTSLDVSVSLAAAAFGYTQPLSTNGKKTIGVGCIAITEETFRERQGENTYYHVSTWLDGNATTYTLKLASGYRSQEAEDGIVTQLLLYALGITQDLRGLSSNESLDLIQRSLIYTYDDLLNGTVKSLLYYGATTLIPDQPIQAIVMPHTLAPKSFDDWQRITTIEKQFHLPVVFEISYDSEDARTYRNSLKTYLTQLEKTGKRIVLTHTNSLAEKSQLFPKSIFAIQVSTLLNLFKRNSESKVLNFELERLKNIQCRLLVIDATEQALLKMFKQFQISKECRNIFQIVERSS